MLAVAPGDRGNRIMINSPSYAPRLVHRLAPVLGLLLLVTLFVGGAHHHVDERGHGCTVCTVAHSPAVAADLAAPAAAPDDGERTLHAPATDAPRPVRVETASSRAPPRSS